jgi:hypothetical protein
MTKYKYFKSKNYRSNVNLVVQSDIVETSDQTSVGDLQNLESVLTEGSNASAKEIILTDESSVNVINNEDDFYGVSIYTGNGETYEDYESIYGRVEFLNPNLNTFLHAKYEDDEPEDTLRVFLPNRKGELSLDYELKDENFTAQTEKKYKTNGTITITDPTPQANRGYIVYVISGTTTIDSVGYTSGNLIYRFYQGGAWSSTVFVSQNKISQILKFLDNESTFEFTQTSDFKINSVVEQSGTEAIIKLSDGTTDYTLGDTVDAFDYLIISVDVAGTIELIGEKL